MARGSVLSCVSDVARGVGHPHRSAPEPGALMCSEWHAGCGMVLCFFVMDVVLVHRFDVLPLQFHHCSNLFAGAS
jgi:hypothetical protein